MKMFLAVATASIGLSAGMTQAAEAIGADRIISAATGDWDKDGNADLALLVAADEDSGDDHSVYLYLEDGEAGRLVLKSVAAGKVWGNLDIAGQGPFLTALPNGSLLITSHNESIGRDRWEQELTVAYRNSGFVVAGYTYTSYDTLDPDNQSDCDFNVLTGRGTADGKPISVEGETVLLRDWTDDRGQTACGNG